MASESSNRVIAPPAAGCLRPCVVATTDPIRINGLQTIDGVLVAVGDRVLVKDQVDYLENGIYVVNRGNWRRARDWRGISQISSGVLVPIAGGDEGARVLQYRFVGDGEPPPPPPWVLATAVAAPSDTISTTSYQAVPLGVAVNPAGTRMYTLGQSPMRITSHDLTTPFLVSTQTNRVDWDNMLVDTDPSGLFVTPDETKLIWCGNTNDRILQATMSTPGDISTLGTVTEYDTTADGVISPVDVAFNGDGTKMFVVESETEWRVTQYNLGVGYDVTTAVFRDDFDSGADTMDRNSRSIWVNNNELYLLNWFNVLHQWMWDGELISTATDNTSTTVGSGAGGTVWGLFMTDTAIIYAAHANDRIYMNDFGPHT